MGLHLGSKFLRIFAGGPFCGEGGGERAGGGRERIVGVWGFSGKTQGFRAAKRQTILKHGLARSTLGHATSDLWSPKTFNPGSRSPTSNPSGDSGCGPCFLLPHSPKHPTKFHPTSAAASAGSRCLDRWRWSAPWSASLWYRGFRDVGFRFFLHFFFVGGGGGGVGCQDYGASGFGSLGTFGYVGIEGWRTLNPKPQTLETK